jgi:penicillin amidase
MLLLRILTQGRACELLSDDDAMFAADRFFRRIGFTLGTEAELDKLPARMMALLDAYIVGINQAFDERVPWELRLLGYKHEPWSRADTLALSRLMAYMNLAQSQGDMERLIVEMVQVGVSVAHLDALFPDMLADLDPFLLKRVALGERIVPEVVQWLLAVPRTIASNNWVIGPSKTASGHAILANDPHLEVGRLPAVWYEAVLELDDLYCIGATMPGLPSIIIGRTDNIAWGVTYAFMDSIDSWIEDCRDGAYKRVEGGEEKWLPFEQRREWIKRKKAADVEVVFYENPHGTLDGDPNEAGLYLATRWASASATGATSLAAMFSLLRVHNVEHGLSVLGQLETAWNWVVADADGNIGYQMSGLLPQRSGERNGLVPLPGWDPSNDWTGLVAPERLPWIVNPEQGFIVTANNDLNQHGRSRPINLPMSPHRANSIAEALARRDDWTVEATAALQLDLHSRHSEPFLQVLRPLLPATENGRILRQWDGRYNADSEGAWLFERFYEALIRDVIGAVLGDDVVNHLLEQTGILTDFYLNFDNVLLDPQSIWYGDRDRNVTFAAVARATLNVEARPWRTDRALVMKHLLFGDKLPTWLGFDHGPVVLEGGRASIRQGQIYRSAGRDTSFAPSYRFVTDMSEDLAHTALAGGVSDRRFSPWYISDVDRWLSGRLKTLTTNKVPDDS